MKSVGTYGRSNLHTERELVFAVGERIGFYPANLVPLPLGLSSASSAKQHFAMLFALRAVAFLLHRMSDLAYRDMSYKAWRKVGFIFAPTRLLMPREAAQRDGDRIQKSAWSATSRPVSLVQRC